MPRRRPQVRTQKVTGNAGDALDFRRPLSRHLVPHGDRGLTYIHARREPTDQATLGTQDDHAGIHQPTIIPFMDDREEKDQENNSPPIPDPGQPAEVDLPTRIRTGRQRVRLSQTALAKHLGVRQSAISQWESGRSVPTLDNCIRLAETLRMPLAELVPPSGVSAPNLLADPIILSVAELVAQIPPQWQVTIQLLLRHLVETLQKQR